MNEPLISVIIPVYNTAKYLDDCIKCLIYQTYHNLEFIFINDGSTDSSAEILQKSKELDQRIKVVTQSNQGLSAARNRGINEAVGSYILFLDSDDWIDLNTCEEAIKAMNQYSADIVMWSYRREYPKTSKEVLLFGDHTLIFDGDKCKKIHRRMVGPIEEELSSPQKIDSLITAWGKLYKRSAIRDVRFVDTKLIGTEDALFNILVYSDAEKVVYLPNTFSHYRKDNVESLTHKYKKRLARQWTELYKQINEHLAAINAPDIYYSALSNRICLGLIGLGINLAEDNSMKLTEKLYELKRILDMPHYRLALKQLTLKYFPVHWKLFFACAKKRALLPVYFMSEAMNLLKKI